MLPNKRTKDEIDNVRIKDWKLHEEEKDGMFYLEVFAVCRIYSEVSAEECRRLLRAIVHTWINFELAQLQTPLQTKEQRKRERLLMINHVPKDRWSWGWAFQKIANLYQNYEGRKQHRAVLIIMGNIWKFDSELSNRCLV